MSHHASKRFWRAFAELTPELQKLARGNYELLKADAQHPSLHFKRVGRYWSARIGSSHRVLGIESPVGIVNDGLARRAVEEGRWADDPGGQ